MADLVIAEASVSDAAVALRAAADPIRDAVCLGSRVVGSDPVAAALDDVEFVLRGVMDALAEVAGDAASDALEVAAAFDALDGAASDAGSSAVFQWAGGEFPGGGFPKGTVQAMDPSYAERLAPRLRDFAAAIQVPDGAELTVVGHSYGGATVGLAEKAGLSAAASCTCRRRGWATVWTRCRTSRTRRTCRITR
jgi:hypothetical protein